MGVQTGDIELKSIFTIGAIIVLVLLTLIANTVISDTIEGFILSLMVDGHYYSLGLRDGFVVLVSNDTQAYLSDGERTMKSFYAWKDESYMYSEIPVNKMCSRPLIAINSGNTTILVINTSNIPVCSREANTAGIIRNSKEGIQSQTTMIFGESKNLSTSITTLSPNKYVEKYEFRLPLLVSGVAFIIAVYLVSSYINRQT